MKPTSYKDHHILFVKASNMYIISEAPISPSLRIAFSTAQAHKLIDALVIAKRKAGAAAS